MVMKKSAPKTMKMPKAPTTAKPISQHKQMAMGMKTGGKMGKKC